MEINSIWKGPAALGEGPLWDAEEQALYWVDIFDKKLYRWDAAMNKVDHWNMPGLIGCVAKRKKGGFIAGIDDDICFIEMPSGKIKRQQTVPDHFRLNDGKCDRQGRFWVGTAAVDKPEGHLYRFDPDGKLHVMQDGIYISNGLGWSPDNTIFYYTDSIPRIIYSYRFNPKTGNIDQQKKLIQIPENEGVPDGLTIDSHGDIWSARWNGWKLVHYSHEGKILEEIKMPVQRPTSCIFGGKDFNTLFITSCSQDVDEVKPLSLPAGSLFAISLKVRGMPEPVFQG